MPTRDQGGVLSTAGAVALREALQRRSARAVTDVLKALDARGMVNVLQETGIAVDPELARQGRAAVYAAVQPLLQQVLRTGASPVLSGRTAPESGSAEVPPMPVSGLASATPRAPAMAAGVGGDPRAISVIERVLQSPKVVVRTLGEETLARRPALQMIAAQAMDREVMGFGFEGVEGRFEVPGTMADVVDLHAQAAAAVAVESARAGLQRWGNGQRVGDDVSVWVPDSIQRLLLGSVSREAADVLASAITGQGIRDHAATLGRGTVSSLMAKVGLDINAPTVEEQAAEINLKVLSREEAEGHFFGVVAATDHRAALLKVNRNHALLLPFSETPGGRPRAGMQFRVTVQDGVMTVSPRSAEKTVVQR